MRQACWKFSENGSFLSPFLYIETSKKQVSMLQKLSEKKATLCQR